MHIGFLHPDRFYSLAKPRLWCQELRPASACTNCVRNAEQTRLPFFSFVAAAAAAHIPFLLQQQQRLNVKAGGGSSQLSLHFLFFKLIKRGSGVTQHHCMWHTREKEKLD